MGLKVGAFVGVGVGLDVGDGDGYRVGFIVGGEVGDDGQSPLQLTVCKFWILIKLQLSWREWNSGTNASVLM